MSRRSALGMLAWGAAAEVAPLAQATSERLALTVAALIAVAVLAILGGLLVLVLRRQAEGHAATRAGGASVADDRALWSAAGAANGAVRADDDLDRSDDDDDGPRDRDEPATTLLADADGAHDDTPQPTRDDADTAPNGAGPVGGGPAHDEPVVRPPVPREAWTAEITWAPDAARFRVVARRPEDPDTAPVALAQTEPLPWPPKDDASVQAMTDASIALESVLLDSGWTPLPAGDAWYAKRFAWEPQAADAQPRPGSGRFERREAGAPAPVPPDGEPRG
jgi:hypothetical protein